MSNVSLTTELSAVNTILSIIGEAPVNTVEDTGVVDAVMARQILQETNRQVQAVGWSWNLDENYKLVPTFPLPGTIYVPANTLAVDPVDRKEHLIVRGTRLWDRLNHTYSFDAPVFVNITRLLDFEELPQPARHYITVRAGRIFQDRVVGSQTLSGFNANDEARAYVQLKNIEAEVAGYTLFTGSRSRRGLS
ncbi:hypothetical protein [Martelella mangrovi]|uniref:Phage tail protein n=1 Tax=Martelella mangrovi TaxID=1397477 RepID=A0ABV2IE96_9HYPH